MKLLSYFSGKELRSGILINNQVFDISQTASKFDIELPSDLKKILELEKGIELVRKIFNKIIREKITGIPLSEIKLGPPVLKPGKILALAGNYQSHLKEGGKEIIDAGNSTPRVFIKPVTCINHHEGAIRIPKRSNKIDYEIELGVVIGKRCRYVKEREALKFVAGYLVFNDISARKLIIQENRLPREGDKWFDWLNGKWFDTFAPIGPYLVTVDEIDDPQNLNMKLWVNGELRQDGNTGQMIFTVAQIIQWIAEFMTLEPGDIIATGTTAGVGMTTSTFLKPGDVIEAEIEKIGRLKNIVAEE